MVINQTTQNQGISTGFILTLTKSYDSVVCIPSDEAIATSRTLQPRRFLAGISSGAAIAAAPAAELGEAKVLTLLPDKMVSATSLQHFMIFKTNKKKLEHNALALFIV